MPVVLVRLVFSPFVSVCSVSFRLSYRVSGRWVPFPDVCVWEIVSSLFVFVSFSVSFCWEVLTASHS